VIGPVTYPTTGFYQTTNPATGQLEKNQGRYRVFYRERADQSNPDNLTNLLKLVDGLNTNSTDGLYTTQMDALLDTEQWMRVFALNDALDNSDSFGNSGGKNMFAYKPLGDKWRLLIWDLDVGLGEWASCLPLLPEPERNAALFYNWDTNTVRLEGHPPFRRAWYRAVSELLNGPMNSASLDPVLTANYAELTNNGFNARSPFEVATNVCNTNYSYSLKSWIDARRALLSNELTGVAVTFAITNHAGSDFFSPVTTVLLGGTAPVDVANIRINSTTSNAPVAWATVTNWTVSVTLEHPGPNLLTVRGYDLLGASNAVDTITITRF